MADTTTPLDDTYVYSLEDLLRPVLREGKQRSRRNNQNLVAEKIIAIEAAIVALGKALVSDEATTEASANNRGHRAKGAGNGATDEGAFPT